jgi:hypothetical protein
MKTGIEIITDERKRQIVEEGFDFKRDDGYDSQQLARAAACYAEPIRPLSEAWFGRDLRLENWPWARSWWKPSPENRIKELAKAGALIAAEIDRLQRKQK